MNDAELAAGLAPTPGYRLADRVGDELFVAGQVPNDSYGAIVGVGDIEQQARQGPRYPTMTMLVPDRPNTSGA